MKHLLLISLLATISCQGTPSEKPPIHLNPNMDYQEKYQPQAESVFFKDKSAMRLPVKGTVKRGGLQTGSPYLTGKDAQGALIAKAPIDINDEVIKHGQSRFEIYCTPCHGTMGDGKGIISSKGFPPPPSFHNDRAYNFADGYFYDKIAKGSFLMPSYGHQIPVKDRWHIVAYIRSLQEAQKK